MLTKPSWGQLVEVWLRLMSGPLGCALAPVTASYTFAPGTTSSHRFRLSHCYGGATRRGSSRAVRGAALRGRAWCSRDRGQPPGDNSRPAALCGLGDKTIFLAARVSITCEDRLICGRKWIAAASGSARDMVLGRRPKLTVALLRGSDLTATSYAEEHGLRQLS